MRLASLRKRLMTLLAGSMRSDQKPPDDMDASQQGCRVYSGIQREVDPWRVVGKLVDGLANRI